MTTLSSGDWDRSALADSPADMWRYGPLLPVPDLSSVVSMGEGWTPLVRARRLGARIGASDIWIKDETVNPTGSWEARAFSCVASAARSSGSGRIETAAGPHAALACAAYAAAAGLQAEVALLAHAPRAIAEACRAYGAVVRSGTLDEHPARLAGLKTTAYELAEQFEWATPVLVLCADALPMEQGFAELKSLGWVSGSVRVVGCPPSLGPEVLGACRELASLEGILAAPEGGACIVELRRLIAEGLADPDARTVVVVAASGLPYAGALAGNVHSATNEADKLGGLITPR